MNQQIAKLYDQSIILEGNGDYVAGELDPAKFADSIVTDCLQYLYSEIDRLIGYQNSLPESDTNKRGDVDICIDKCHDNIQGLKQHFGVS